MIDGKKVLAVIPARGGSKGLPRKNLRTVRGKPLIAWTIEQAKGSRFVDRLILSSEDEQIIETARKLGCEVPFVRPASLAEDNVSATEAVIHAIEQLPSYNYVVMLQPTCPLRLKEDIDGCIELCMKKKAQSVVSVTLPQKSPYWMFKRKDNLQLAPLLPLPDNSVQRQDLPEVVVLNGAVYVAETGFLQNNKKFITSATLGYMMPAARSLDIDTELDLSFFEFLASRRAKTVPMQG